MKPGKAVSYTYFPDLHKVLLKEGYKEGAPNSWIARTDEKCCELNECAECGGSELRYRPFTQGVRYLAFAHCLACDHAEEF